jgi:hypothetical protein
VSCNRFEYGIKLLTLLLEIYLHARYSNTDFVTRVYSRSRSRNVVFIHSQNLTLFNNPPG